ncbi:MAG: hypothetical protein H6932_14610 [Burkholderiaceae bacterium]|nr:hypothetical protein [Burkholderiaceae bacterium]
MLALVAGAASAVQRPEQTREEREFLDAVHVALRHRDCAAVVQRLNDGLAAKLPDAFLMAGTMYEEGLCLKRSWERAAEHYGRAWSTGHTGGGYRMIAGLASREPGAALWWAQRVGQAMPAACRVPAEVHADVQAFVAALNAWPAGRLQACSHVAGVVATVIGEAEYPGEALGQMLEGSVQLRYRPAEARLEWQNLETRALAHGGLLRGEPLQDRESRAARDRMRAALETLGQRALARYPRPEGIDPNWLIEVHYEFQLR